MPEPDALANEGWFNNRWRPFLAWTYASTVIADFLAFPVFQTIWYGPGQYHEWHPLTLQGGGLYHMAMGAIIGVATWQRTQEKLAIMKTDSGSYSESSHTIETVT